MEPVGLSKHTVDDSARSASRIRGGFNFDSSKLRDVFLDGDCDATIKSLCRRLGYTEALHRLYPGRLLAQPSPTRNGMPRKIARDCENRPARHENVSLSPLKRQR